jgi:excinuclease UvrABC ATPase subunit
MMKNNKKCSKCQVEKSLDEFAVNSRNKTDGKCSKCKSCQKEYRDNNKHKIAKQNKNYREKNTELVKQKKSEYYFKNKDEINAKHKKYREENDKAIKIGKKLEYQKNKKRYIERAKKWREQNPDFNKTKKYKDQRNKTRKKRYSEDVLYKLGEKIRSWSIRITNAVKKNKSLKSIEYLGCTLEEFKDHIESQWQEGMTWENHDLHGWHIDHIVPVNWFVKNSDDPWQANHYTNLQPLWAIDNIKKSNNLS